MAVVVWVMQLSRKRGSRGICRLFLLGGERCALVSEGIELRYNLLLIGNAEVIALEWLDYLSGSSGVMLCLCWELVCLK